MATIQAAFDALQPSPYMHISVRRRTHPGIDYLGGGRPESVLRRFRDQEIESSCIVDSILIIYVR